MTEIDAAYQQGYDRGFKRGREYAMDNEKNKKKIHELKCWPEFFEPALAGEKMFELRNDDRNFKVGDIVVLHEYFVQPEDVERIRVMDVVGSHENPHPPGNYTGRAVARTITYILKGPAFGLRPGWVILALK
jgi:hypothetical protein